MPRGFSIGLILLILFADFRVNHFHMILAFLRERRRIKRAVQIALRHYLQRLIIRQWRAFLNIQILRHLMIIRNILR